jgi:hypothetical protein
MRVLQHSILKYPEVDIKMLFTTMTIAVFIVDGIVQAFKRWCNRKQGAK